MLEWLVTQQCGTVHVVNLCQRKWVGCHKNNPHVSCSYQYSKGAHSVGWHVKGISQNLPNLVQASCVVLDDVYLSDGFTFCHARNRAWHEFPSDVKENLIKSIHSKNTSCSLNERSEWISASSWIALQVQAIKCWVWVHPYATAQTCAYRVGLRIDRHDVKTCPDLGWHIKHLKGHVCKPNNPYALVTCV